MKIENIYLKNTLKTIVLYASIYIVLTLLDWWAPSGPCTPGPALLLLIGGVPLIVAFLFALNLTLFIKGKEGIVISLLIHGVVLVIMIFTFFRYM